MVALQKMLESGETISRDDCAKVEGMAQQYLQRALTAANSFPPGQRILESGETIDFQPLLVELPQYCCSALVTEVQEPRAIPEPVVTDFGIGGVAPGG